jgi:formylglycine-generating enzyme required for sulfatase activity
LRTRALAAAGLAAGALAIAARGPAAVRASDALPDAVLNTIGMRMVLLPAGTFVMGSPAGTPMRQDEETTRRVTLTRAFRISATEVTQQQWLALMPANRSARQGPDLPATSMSWSEADEFCRKLSEKEKSAYRLPTEAEWEYACRAGADGVPPSAAERDATAWFAANSEEALQPAGRKQPNGWGLFDMLGNVAEWTADAYGPYPGVEDDRDPTGPATGGARVVRGGSWRSFPPAVRCAARASAGAAYQLPHVGLRVVQEIGAAAEPRQ